MEMTEHWRLRLLELVEASGMKPTRFAERCDITPSYFLRLLYPPGKAGRKNLGPETMHKISGAFGLPPGWFDMPRGTPASMGQGEPKTLAPYGSAHAVAEPTHQQVIAFQSGVAWPFAIVTYRRIQRIREHFSGRGKPNAISDIDKHLDVLVTRWENEIEKQNRTAA